MRLQLIIKRLAQRRSLASARAARPLPRLPGGRLVSGRRTTVALALAGLIVAGLWPKPPIVETTRVATGPLRVTVNEEGKTRIKQRYLVAAPVAASTANALPVFPPTIL